jgi:hypothetical protein
VQHDVLRQCALLKSKVILVGLAVHRLPARSIVDGDVTFRRERFGELIVDLGVVVGSSWNLLQSNEFSGLQ